MKINRHKVNQVFNGFLNDVQKTKPKNKDRVDSNAHTYPVCSKQKTCLKMCQTVLQGHYEFQPRECHLAILHK